MIAASDVVIDEIKSILIEVAKQPSKTLSYLDLANKIKSARIDPRAELRVFLEVVSRSEYREGRGILTVLVGVNGGMPGAGFFLLAKELGLKGEDEDIYMQQCKVVRNYWQNAKNP